MPHLHVHVFARYPGTPEEFWRERVDEWSQSPKGGAEEVTALAQRLRDYLAESAVVVDEGEGDSVMQGCLFCDIQRGHPPAMGGPVYEDDLVYAYHWDEEGSNYLGHLVLITRRHTPDFADLTPAEAQAVGLLITRLSSALKVYAGAEKVYAVFYGEVTPHLHIHLTARYRACAAGVPALARRGMAGRATRRSTLSRRCARDCALPWRRIRNVLRYSPHSAVMRGRFGEFL